MARIIYIKLFMGLALLILLPFIIVMFWRIIYPAPDDSIIEFTFDNYSGKWISKGFTSVADQKMAKFCSDKSDNFPSDIMFIELKSPISESFDQGNSKIKFYDSRDVITNKPMYGCDNSNTQIKIVIKKWSDKPRGQIDGIIEATLYDKDGKSYYMTGRFKAYQADGTMYSK